MALQEEILKILIQGVVNNDFYEATVNLYDDEEFTISRSEEKIDIKAKRI